MSLTPAKEHYVKTIYILSGGNQGVQITEIAERLEISKSSVCMAMKSLQEENFVYRNEKRLVFITEKGEKQALRLMKKYEIIRCFLTEVLELNSEIAAQDACAMEHIIGPETLRSIRSLTKQHKNAQLQEPEHQASDFG